MMGEVRKNVFPDANRLERAMGWMKMNKIASMTRKGRIPYLLILIPLLALLASFAPLQAQTKSSLYFLEFQAVSSWNFSQKSLDFYSYLPHHPMQKNGLGLETLIRLYRQKADLGYFSFQLRAVYDEHQDNPLQLQLYNALFRFKTRIADFWAGHSKPTLGLNYSLDNHALLLPDASMLGHNFDRDWGAGLHRDFRWGDAGLSLTTGSGMRLRFNRNYLLSGRISYGVLARDNFSLGLSAFTGRVLDEMEEEQTNNPASWSGISLDGSYFWLNWESRLEVNLGRRAGQHWHLLFWRQGFNLLDEARLKLEAQLGLLKHGVTWTYLVGTGVSYRLNADFTLRSMFLYDRQQKNYRLVFQLYYYRNIL